MAEFLSHFIVSLFSRINRRWRNWDLIRPCLPRCLDCQVFLAALFPFPQLVTSIFSMLRLLWVYCPGHDGVSGNEWADRLASTADITSGLHFRSRLQTSCIPLWRPLRPAGIPIPQAPKPDQSPTASCSYQEGCSAMDSSPLWNIRKWASRHPGKGGCQRTTACQQCQLQWKEDSSGRSQCQDHRGMTTICHPGSSKSFWWGFALDITDWTVICMANWSCHPHQPAPVVKKNKPQSMFYKDAPFSKLQEKTCGQSALPWWPNSTAASLSWRRRHHSSPEQPWSCRLRTPRRRGRRHLVCSLAGQRCSEA